MMANKLHEDEGHKVTEQTARVSVDPQGHLSRCVVHHFLVGEVTLVAHEQLVDVLAGIAIDLLQPLLHVVVRLLQYKKRTPLQDC